MPTVRSAAPARGAVSLLCSGTVAPAAALAATGTGRRIASLTLALVLFLVVGVPSVLAGTKTVSGAFTSVSVPPPTCTSAVGICTLGTLTGDLPSTYFFVMDTLQNAGDPTDPTKFLYTGHSVITLARGGARLFGKDTGVMHIPPGGAPAPFVTTVSVVGGTNQYAGASGQIVASGTLNFGTGDAVGTYTGAITKPEDAPG
jgi:hypothetical protein